MEKVQYLTLIERIREEKFGFELTLLTPGKGGDLQEAFKKSGYDLKKLEKLALNFVKNFIS